uniref:hypothetical protein n=1 Tax=uncultured Polaribacter sp. TaxID=174711 RepID=UPI002621C75F
MEKIIKNSNLKKNIVLLLNFILSITIYTTNAQEIRVIDNKGTITKIRNNQVTTSATAPTTPLEGDFWFDTTTNISKIYDGTSWLTVDEDTVTSSATAPTIPVEGDIWFNTSKTPNTLNVWDGTQWEEIINNTWSLKGNSGTSSATDFVGTTDAQALV